MIKRAKELIEAFDHEGLPETSGQLKSPKYIPIGWEYRWYDSNPNTVTYGKWSEWERVVPRNQYIGTVEDTVREIQFYIDNNMGKYELRQLFVKE